MGNNIIDSIDDVNQMFKEITKYTIYGLATDGMTWKKTALIKQWYLERILLSLGMSLADVRKKLGALEGENPNE